jgi:DNA-binding NarL/FixJ family response regulator
MNSHRIIVADDHPLFRAALKETIHKILPHCELVEAQDINSLQQAVSDAGDADLILLDLHMPGAHGFSGLIYLSAHHSELPVAIVSAHETPEIMYRALDYGAAGFLPKSSSIETIADAINSILAGERWLPPGMDINAQHENSEERQLASALSSLTPQQFRVASMLSEGLLNKQIAYELTITEATVKAHVTEIFKKLGVHSRTQTVLLMSKLDVQPPGQPPSSA